MESDIKERYISTCLEFFKDVGFSDREVFVSTLNGLNEDYATRFLFSIAFYQSLDTQIAKDENRLRPVLLFILIDAVEENNNLIDDFKSFLRRLEKIDKLYLLDNLKIRDEAGGGYQRVYHELFKESRYTDYGPSYQTLDRNLKNIDKYIDVVAQHLYNIRNYVLHEFGPTTPFAFSDNQYGLFDVFAGYSINKKGGERRWESFYTQISLPKFTNIVKQGILKKIGILI
ncbi:MAG: hypothetical protein HZA80_03030 [Candidatus Taylorbacteria bacterium]|nr:hypothetical protein [Candidatus Taylorbacteria bacterium]